MNKTVTLQRGGWGGVGGGDNYQHQRERGSRFIVAKTMHQV